MRNSHDQKTISELKSSVSIVDYIGSVIELKKAGSNFAGCCPFHSEKTPSFMVSETKQMAKCFGGDCFSGDVLDFIEKYHKLETPEAVEKLRAFENSSYIPNKEYHEQKQIKHHEKVVKKSKEQIEQKLKNLAKALINNNNKLTIFKSSALENSIISISINPIFEKLFEKKHIVILPEHQKRLAYLVNYILAYDSFFNCPAIILRDSKSKVCDIARYRANKPKTFTTFSNPKYMYVKEEDKLKNRGDDFIFPFFLEMDRLINKYDFFFIGEGLKNAVNAFLFGVPFVSLESSSNDISDKLKKYIKEKAKTKKIIGGFDGDEKTTTSGTIIKGKGAYLKTKKSLGVEFSNLFEFDSNIDFTDYLKNEFSLIDFDKKFNKLFLEPLNSYKQGI